MSKRLEIPAIDEVKNVTNKLVEELLKTADPKQLFGREGIFEQLKKRIVERVLEGELEHELGYGKHSKAVKGNSNRRNGSYQKTIIDENSQEITIDVPEGP